jgi:two-component system cell cycle sensor histidine kinase/response regulator CckA
MEQVSKARILVVEDDAAVGRFIIRVLEAAGYEAVLASESEAAASAVRERAVDLVVSDIVLGTRDGHDVAEELRAIQPEVKIVFMSGYGASRYGSLPDDPVLPKPIDAAQLVARVEQELSD